nr:8-oxo-dGTP diphosphatase [Sediminibacillus massiliensis]
MRRVTNCILKKNNHILLLKKPRRGWYAMPGGKMEQGESIKESAMREFWEETGLHLINPDMRGAFTFLVQEDGNVTLEWMMFTFFCEDYNGTLLAESPEGILEWVAMEDLPHKQMAEGDRHILRHILNSEDIVYGRFNYSPEYELIDLELDPPSP